MKMKRKNKNYNFKNINYHVNKIYEKIYELSEKITEILQEKKSENDFYKIIEPDIPWCSTIRSEVSQKSRISKNQSLKVEEKSQGPILESNFSITFETELTQDSAIIQFIDKKCPVFKFFPSDFRSK